jgi:polar amino acid transport system substrate-binding protein
MPTTASTPYALPVLINQTLDSEWFRLLAFLGIVAFALSGVVLAYEGQYTLFGALVLAALPAVGSGIVRDLLLQRDPLGIVQHPEALLTVFGTVLAGMVVIKIIPSLQGGLLTKHLQTRARLGARLIEVFDAIALAAFTVVGVVVVLDIGPAALAMGSNRGCPHRLIWRPDAGPLPP